MKRIVSPTVLLLFLMIPLHTQAQMIDTLVNTGLYKLHFKIIKGKGTAILFESGGAMDASQWDNIAAAVHQATSATTITYDRQGFGKSGLDTLHYYIQNEITGLEMSLKQLGYSHKPMIIVCHSLGNFYASLYTSRHPEQIKGLVMLDPRIASIYDRKHAQDIFNSLDQYKLKKENLILYKVLFTMAQNGNVVRHAKLPVNLPILDIMAEKGPFPSDAENEHFKNDQRQFIKKFNNHQLLFAKGSEHNIARDKLKLIIRHVISFYKSYH